MDKPMQWLQGFIETYMPIVVQWLDDYGHIILGVMYVIYLIDRYIEYSYKKSYQKWEEEEEGKMGK